MGDQRRAKVRARQNWLGANQHLRSWGIEILASLLGHSQLSEHSTSSLYHISGIFTNQIRDLRITQLETQLIGKDYQKKSLILSLIYFRTAVSWGWVPMILPPASCGPFLHLETAGS